MKTPPLLPRLAEIDELRASGMSVKKIADRIGAKYTATYNAVHRLGVYSPNSKNYGRLIPVELLPKIDKLCQMHCYGYVAERLGLDYRVVRRAHLRIDAYEGAP
jgi:hypothetical protein